jgi:phosphate starvation-inducible PhoH-like protein
MRTAKRVKELSDALLANGDAKKLEKVYAYTKHDLIRLLPLTTNQERWLALAGEYDYIVGNGSAGTGKTFLAMHKALHSVIVLKTHKQILIIRSAVPCRDIGHLPGTETEKLALYEEPYEALCYELLGRPTAYENLKKAGIIKFRSTSFMRGITFNNTIVILEEAQNMSFGEINTIMTRLGQNTRLYVCADDKQKDLKKDSGYHQALLNWEAMPSFGMVHFNIEDVVRSPIVKEWIIQCEV